MTAAAEAALERRRSATAGPALRRRPRRARPASWRRWSRRSSAGECDLAVAAFARRVGGGFGFALRLRALGDPQAAAASRPTAPISGQRAMRAEVLRAVLPFAAGYGMEIGMTVDAVRAGYRVAEIELDLEHRATGRTLAGFVHRGRQLRDFVARLSRPARRRGDRLAARDPRDRPGHDRDAPASSSTARAGSRGRAYSEFAPALPAPGLGRARRRTRSGTSPGGSPRTRSPTRGRRRRASTRSGSPTSARPSSPGTRTPASRSTTRSSGRTGAPRRAATSCARPGHEPLVRERTGLVLDPYFSGTKIEWLLAQRRRRASGRRLRDDRLLARLQAHRRATRPTLERLADDAVRHPRAALGPGALRAARRRPGARCPSRCPRRASSAPRPSSAARSRSPGSPATSRRRCSARPATSPGWRRTPTAPAASSCSTRARACPTRSRAC